MAAILAMPTTARAIWRTLLFHVVFFAALGSTELFFPDVACRDGLAGPLTLAGLPVDRMCVDLLASPAGQLVLFGLAKYHLLFGLISSVAAFGFARQPAASRLTVQRGVLLLHALNFAADVAWASRHLHWIGAGPAALVPQLLLVVWNVRCSVSAVVDAPDKS